MAIDYDKLLRDLEAAVVDPIKGQVTDFLNNNTDAREFVTDRAKRLAALGLEYVQATSDDRRNAVLLQIKVVRQSIENEVSSIALNESIVARATFKKVVSAAVDVLVKLIPVLIQAI